jgi:flagellar assembly protein FliH
MSVSHLLEDFGALTRGDLVEMTDVLLEEERLEAFERGYQAGWDDSAKAQESQAGHVSAEFSQAIADITFTYEEAFRNLLDGVRPLITQIVETVLPTVAHETLAPRVAEIIMQEVADHGRQAVVVCVAPSRGDALSAEDLSQTDVPVSVREDASLSTDEIRIRFDDRVEQEIDIRGTITQISAAIDSYFTTDPAEEQRKSA